MASDPAPVTDLASKAVFTADGARVGRVTDVIVDLEAETPVALAVGDVAERTVGGLPAAAAGVRVPFRLVGGIGDVIVLRTAAHEAPSRSPAAGTGSRRAPRATGRQATAEPTATATRSSDPGALAGGRAAGFWRPRPSRDQ
ncbi:PRC-barrel domain-containing protein [Halobaculum litoreum]|uniref:PRC-barrel domain-containing protein n=1 Tax=Halobaculum litoreum TaxID=3031998 RepID=A0ABD5XWB2_9EURY|nr:PRC-barrel domain-containing protein [Halobaculum sp. DT92]